MQSNNESGLEGEESVKVSSQTSFRVYQTAVVGIILFPKSRFLSTLERLLVDSMAAWQYLYLHGQSSTSREL